MANEITISVSISVNKTGDMTQPIARQLSGQTVNMAGAYSVGGTITVGTSEAAIPLGSVTTPHWGWFYNLDATNYIQLYNGSAGAVLVRLNPGDPPALIPIDPASTPYAKAHTGACKMEYLIFEA